LTSGFLEPGTRLALVLFLLFGFNLSRGISSAAWLPWMTSLVPLEVRGRYLARDAVCVHLASCVTLVVAALCLGRDPAAWQFALLFAFSAINGAISLGFLKQIPDVAPSTPPGGSREPVPWGAIARHEPFRKLLRMSVAWSVAYGGVTTFTVAFLKREAGMTDGRILLVSALAFLGGLAGLAYFESRTDRLGSKPVVTFCLSLWVALMAGWAAVAAGWCWPGLALVLGLEWVMGFAYALVNMNLTRLAMVLVPTLGRSHFFALYSVVANLTLGLSPILWGLVIDAIGTRQIVWQGGVLNRYGVFFLGAGLAFVATLVLSRRLDEPRAQDIDVLIQELLRYPQRLWLRLWPRG
jgi:MFS family permease